MRPARIRLLVGLLAALGTLFAAGCGEQRTPIRVFAADALATSFHAIKYEFERRHPDSEVLLDVQGSIMLTRLAPLRRGDVLAVADHRLIEKMLSPKHATWVAQFAGTEVVLAAQASSSRRAEIRPDNWFDILLDPKIRFGYADPAQDPCGYYTRIAWALAEKHYFTSRGPSRPLAMELAERCPREHVAIDALNLISAYLNMARVDYAFVYRVHAVDHRLPYTPLPKEISLGDRSLASHYGSVQVLVPNYRGGTESMSGAPIAFGITVLQDAPNSKGAEAFVRFVLSKDGQDILGRSGFQPIQPAVVPKWGAVPDFLADVAIPEK